MREVELKAAVNDRAACIRRLEMVGATRLFRGDLVDRRWDTPDRTMTEKDEVLRLRIHHDESGEAAVLDWKGPSRRESGYKVREEITVTLGSAEQGNELLSRLGYVVTRAIDRRIEVWRLGNAVIRFEEYPDMDELVEVEGDPESIEAAIVALDIPRAEFTAESLDAFVWRFESRTGRRARVSRDDPCGVTDA